MRISTHENAHAEIVIAVLPKAWCPAVTLTFCHLKFSAYLFGHKKGHVCDWPKVTALLFLIQEL